MDSTVPWRGNTCTQQSGPPFATITDDVFPSSVMVYRSRALNKKTRCLTTSKTERVFVEWRCGGISRWAEGEEVVVNHQPTWRGSNKLTEVYRA
eukprot:2778208-Pyramimonas_sp.AAC.2